MRRAWSVVGETPVLLEDFEGYEYVFVTETADGMHVSGLPARPLLCINTGLKFRLVSHDIADNVTNIVGSYPKLESCIMS